MRASSYPNVANAGARFFELMVAIVAAGLHATTLDTALKAVQDEAGEDVFPDGTSTTEAEAQDIFEERPQFLEQFGTITSRFAADGAAGGAGAAQFRLRLTALQLRALGAVTTGIFAVGSQPAKARAVRAYILNLGTALTGLVTLVAKLGVAAAHSSLLANATVFAANAANETAPVTPVASYTVATPMLVELTAGANFSLLDALILDATEVLEVVFETIQ
jgi:hypothetical protein